jgi:hypothetical protein
MDQRKDDTPPPSDKTRVVFNVRVRRSSKKAIEARAKLEGVTASDLARRLLAFGMANMPEEWGR